MARASDPSSPRGRVPRLLAGVLLASLSFAARSATASAPWTPSPAARSAIEQLVDEAGLALTVSQWPLPRAAVAQALDALPASLPGRLGDARALVRHELDAATGARATLRLREHRDALSGFGDDATPGSGVAVRTPELDGPHLALQFGARVEARSDPGASGVTGRLDDTAVATEAFGVQLQAWSHRSWWGPGWQSALPLGNNAPAMGGVGLQRASTARSDSPWLSWLGPWTGEFFIARTQGEPESPDPLIVGTRLTFRPFDSLEIGFTRMAQWGGGSAPTSLHSFVDMLLARHTNVDPGSTATDPANELAGFDGRLRCPAGLRCAAYTQWEGEDEANGLPSRYLMLGGLEGWTADGAHRFFVEATVTSCWQAREPIEIGCAYRNHAYPGGYADDGRWLGANVGPDSRVLTFGWIGVDDHSVARLDVGRIGTRIGTFSPDIHDPASSGRLIGLSLRHTFDWGPVAISPEIDWNRVHAPAGRVDATRLGVTFEAGLGDLGRAVPTRLGVALGDARQSPGQALLAGGALLVGSALLDHRADAWARHHQEDSSSHAIVAVGDAVPIVGLGAAAWMATSARGTREGDIGWTSLASGATAFVLNEAVKLAVDRSRPDAGRGATDFGHASRGRSSFPSQHAAVAWAVLTPIAQAEDAPWLYGVATLANASRVAARDHWLSDTVAGAMLGYATGRAWTSHEGLDGRGSAPRVALLPHAVVASWQW